MVGAGGRAVHDTIASTPDGADLDRLFVLQVDSLEENAVTGSAGGLVYELAGPHMATFRRLRGESEPRRLAHAQPRGQEEGSRQRQSHARPFAVEPEI